MFVHNVFDSDAKFIHNNPKSSDFKTHTKRWPKRLYVRVLIFHLSALFYEKAVMTCKHFSIGCGALLGKWIVHTTKKKYTSLLLSFDCAFCSHETNLYTQFEVVHPFETKRLSVFGMFLYLKDSNISHISK